mmetsp:Transcript_20868/g.41707  ORF Transcript_20868/g.41707 Transcript_20868/m.41707 type:complete len:153 (+) Transcript_20868:82-540(+)
MKTFILKDICVLFLLFQTAFSWTPPAPAKSSTRLPLPAFLATAALATTLLSPLPSYAGQAPCLPDCTKNCKLLAPNDKSGYCLDSCTEYCADPDRTDGLSGSTSSSGGEYGILGGGFGQGTVVKGEDKPPRLDLPGLDFLKSEKGRNLIGEK